MTVLYIPLTYTPNRVCQRYLETTLGQPEHMER